MFLALLEVQLYFMMLMVMISVAFFSLYERKMMGVMQFREGPSKVSWSGILQPISDALKLVSKFNFPPNISSKFVYTVSPILFMVMSLLIWLTSSFSWGLNFIQSSFLMIILCFSISVYGVILLGWFSNSKYSTLGSVRTISQSISYEVVLSFSIFSIMVISMSFSISLAIDVQEMVWLIVPFSPISMIMFIAFLAEGNRSPFDLAEGESELVCGYCVEYGSSSYTLVFLSENIYLLFMSYMFVLFFLSGSSLFMKLTIITCLFVWVRATVPRMRFDNMMKLCWVNLMPVTLALLGLICLLF